MYIKQENYGRVFKNRAYEKNSTERKLKKLSQYEKTGLTPEQITQMDAMYADKCRQLADKTAAIPPKDAIKTIAQLEKLHMRCKNMMDGECETEILKEDCNAIEVAIESIRQQDNSIRNAGKDTKDTKIYLSGPITGTDDYIDRFREAEDRLTEQGYSVINPAKLLAGLPSRFTHEDCMTICIGLLTACDAICMLDGWQASCGANREYGYAIARGMKRVPADTNREK